MNVNCFPLSIIMRYFTHTHTRNSRCHKSLNSSIQFLNLTMLTQLLCVGVWEDYLVVTQLLCVGLWELSCALYNVQPHSSCTHKICIAHTTSNSLKCWPREEHYQMGNECSSSTGFFHILLDVCLIVLGRALDIPDCPQFLLLLPPTPMLRLQPYSTMSNSQVHVWWYNEIIHFYLPTKFIDKFSFYLSFPCASAYSRLVSLSGCSWLHLLSCNTRAGIRAASGTA